MEMSPWLYRRASVFLWISGWLKRMTLGVRAIVVDGEKVLLVKHSYLPGWHFPGGGVDGTETMLEAALREVVEETGHVVKADDAKLVGIYRNTIPPGRDHVAVYVISAHIAPERFVPNREIIEIGWFARNQLPDDTSNATRARLKELFEDAPASELWLD